MKELVLSLFPGVVISLTPCQGFNTVYSWEENKKTLNTPCRYTIADFLSKKSPCITALLGKQCTRL